jgi:hypothetical protein
MAQFDGGDHRNRSSVSRATLAVERHCVDFLWGAPHFFISDPRFRNGRLLRSACTREHSWVISHVHAFVVYSLSARVTRRAIRHVCSCRIVKLPAKAYDKRCAPAPRNCRVVLFPMSIIFTALFCSLRVRGLACPRAACLRRFKETFVQPIYGRPASHYLHRALAISLRTPEAFHLRLAIE